MRMPSCSGPIKLDPKSILSMKFDLKTEWRQCLLDLILRFNVLNGLKAARFLRHPKSCLVADDLTWTVPWIYKFIKGDGKISKFGGVDMVLYYYYYYYFVPRLKPLALSFFRGRI